MNKSSLEIAFTTRRQIACHQTWTWCQSPNEILGPSRALLALPDGQTERQERGQNRTPASGA